MFKISITSTTKGSPKDMIYEEQIIDRISRVFETVDEIKDFLTSMYGHMPGGRNKVYIDDQNGESIVTGFTHSYWNKDISHNSKSWFQTDWITTTEFSETPVNIFRKI